jgi:hypothetical protein
VNVYRTECGLSDVESHSFPNSSTFSSLNVSITNTIEVARNFRISNKNEGADLGADGLNII